MWEACKFKVCISSVILAMVVLCLATGLLLSAAAAAKSDVGVKQNDTKSLPRKMPKNDTSGNAQDSTYSSTELQSTPSVEDTLSTRTPPSVSAGSSNVSSASTDENTNETENANISEPTSTPSENVESSESTTASSTISSDVVETMETTSPTSPDSSAVGETITQTPTVVPTAPSETTPSKTSTSSTQDVKSKEETSENLQTEAESSQSIRSDSSYSLTTVSANMSLTAETTPEVNESASDTNTNLSTEYSDMITGSTIISNFTQSYNSDSSNQSQSQINSEPEEAISSSGSIRSSTSLDSVLHQNMSTYPSTLAKTTVGIDTRLGSLSPNEGGADTGVDRRKHGSGDTLTAGQKTALAVCTIFVSIAAVLVALTLYRRKYQIGNWKLLNKSMRYKPWSYTNGTYQDDVL